MRVDRESPGAGAADLMPKIGEHQGVQTDQIAESPLPARRAVAWQASKRLEGVAVAICECCRTAAVAFRSE